MRAEGLLPGIVYGESEENRMITLARRSFEAVMRRATEGSVIIDLKLEEQDEDLKVLIKEVQRDPVTSRLLHVDLMHISMDKPVRLEIPVRLIGVSEGVRTEGGFLDHVLRELEIECLPLKIPEVIEVDISPLGIGDSVHAGEISHEGVEIVTPADRVVVAVHGKSAAELRTEEAEAAAAAEAEAVAEGEKPAEGAEAGEQKGEQKDEQDSAKS